METINLQNCYASVFVGRNSHQCSFKKKIGDFCTRHSKKSDVKRWDNLSKSSPIIDDLPINDSLILDPILPKFLNYQIDYPDDTIPNNETDYITFLPISEFQKETLFYYHDEKKLLWVFTIDGFNAILDKSGGINPYNLLPIQEDTIRRFNLFKISSKKSLKELEKHKSTKDKLDEETGEKSEEKENTLSICIRVFQLMDQLDQYTKIEWFMDLSKEELQKLWYEVADIWFHRAGLTSANKLKYVKDGILFNISQKDLKNLSFKQLRRRLLQEFERLITEGETKGEKTTGALWILTGLTLVHYDARNALPWLYQSAHHN